MRNLIPTLIILTLCLPGIMSFAQDKTSGHSFRVAFYNVENLFDTIDDPTKEDAEFLPTGRIPWTAARYQKKLDRMSEVITGLAGDKPVAVLGLCEVENLYVLKELVTTPALLKYNYQVVHFESPDERGIDNALIYDPVQFRLISATAIPVNLGTNVDKTRDILYVKGIPVKSKGDTLHIFINHWPSRSEGREVSEPKRLIAAETLKLATDSLIKSSPDIKIIIMGDFNDEPADKSLSETLGALELANEPLPGKLYNLGYATYRQGKGTLYYKDWDVFDQVIVNGEFLRSGRGLVIAMQEQGIFSPDYLFYKGNDGTLRPNRTAAKDYYGGYSDHLPVYLDMIIRK
jgi:endonuclease/exonuclease/phosphatase family metal-dependent hydrolase